MGVPFGALLAGSVVDHVGLTATLTGFAIAYFLTTLDPFVRSAWAGLDRSPATGDPIRRPPATRVTGT